MRKILFALLALLTLASGAKAQKYEVECLRGDSAEVYPAKMDLYEISGRTDTVYSVEPTVVFRLADGEVIDAVGRHFGAQSIFHGYEQSHLIFERGGKLYGVSTENLVFSQQNAGGVENRLLSSREVKKHTWQGRLFMSYTPYIIIALLFLGLLFLGGMAEKRPSYRRVARVAMPVVILVGSLLELWAYCVLGSDCFWWCDREHFGFWSSLLRIIPFALIVCYQVLSMRLYEQVLFGEDFNPDVDERISVKPALYSLLGVIPAIIVCAVLQSVLGLNHTFLGDVLILVGGLAALLSGLLLAVRRNTRLFGSFSVGLATTLFGIVYIIGCVVAVWGLVLVVFKLIIQILMIGAAIAFIVFMLPKDAFGGGGSGGSGEPRMMWRDDDGGMHYTRVDAEEANKRIAERKANNSL